MDLRGPYQGFIRPTEAVKPMDPPSACKGAVVGVRGPFICIRWSFIGLIILHCLATNWSERASLGLNRPSADMKCSSVTNQT